MVLGLVGHAARAVGGAFSSKKKRKKRTPRMKDKQVGDAENCTVRLRESRGFEFRR